MLTPAANTKQKYNENTAGVLKYLRLSQGLNQDEMARIMGCSKFRLSRLESAKLSLLSIEATNTSRYFNISIEDFAWGHVTRLPKSNDFESFQVPEKYRENAFSGGRTLYLHTESFKSYFGTTKFNELCESERLDPNYFTNISNSLNMSFNLRLLQEMIRNKVLGTRVENEAYVRKHLHSLHHSGFLHEYNSVDGLQRLIALFNHADEYEKNHKYEVLWHDPTKNYVDVKISLSDHVNKKDYFEAPWVGGFLMREFLPTYFSVFINSPNKGEVISTDDDGQKSSVLRYSLCSAI